LEISETTDSRMRANSRGSQRGWVSTLVKIGSSLSKASRCTWAMKVVCSRSTRTRTSAAIGKSASSKVFAS